MKRNIFQKSIWRVAIKNAFVFIFIMKQEKYSDEFFAARHSIKPKGEDVESEQYPGISEKGVELARKKAMEVLKFLDASKEGTVMFIGGASDLIRTKSTAHVFGDEIKKIAQEHNRNDLLVLTEEDIVAGKEEGYSKKIKKLINQINNNPDKKVVISFPLFLKEFSLGFDKWMDKNGKLTPFAEKLLQRNNNDDRESFKDWIQNKGIIDDLRGPNPIEVAQEQLKGIERLKKFISKYLPDRSSIVGSVGHGWNLDALAVYLANNGKIDLEGFKKIGGDAMSETQMIRIENNSEGTKFVYGDNMEIKL